MLFHHQFDIAKDQKLNLPIACYIFIYNKNNPKKTKREKKKRKINTVVSLVFSLIVWLAYCSLKHFKLLFNLQSANSLNVAGEISDSLQINVYIFWHHFFFSFGMCAFIS